MCWLIFLPAVLYYTNMGQFVALIGKHAFSSFGHLCCSSEVTPLSVMSPPLPC